MDGGGQSNSDGGKVMLDKVIEGIIQSYSHDIEDYENILEKMNEFNSFLDREKNTIDLLKQEKSPTHLPSRLDGNFEQKLTQFTKDREEIFRRLKLRTERLTALQSEVRRETGGLPFDPTNLKSFLSESRYKELVFITENLKQIMNTVLEMDDQIIPRLKQELEAVKEELHRIQGAKKTRNAYQGGSQREARFIDKTK